MHWWLELRHKLTFLRKDKNFDDDLASEIRFHQESRVEELISAGMSAREARAQAQREFGPRLRVHEDSRAAWQFQWLEDLFADLKYAARALRRNPGFAAAAIVSLALGIGVNTSIFSLTTEFLFSQPSARDPVGMRYIILGGNSHAQIQEYRFLQDAHAFAGIAGSNEETEANWRNGSTTERIWAVNATGNFFDVTGAPVALGRPFHAGEEDEVVLSHSFWQAKLGGNPDILGRRLVLDGEPYSVVGVLPADHRTLTGFGISPDLYKTFRKAEFPLALYVRLPKGMSLGEASTRIRQLATQLDHLYPNPDRKRTVNLEMRAVAGFERLRSLSMLPFTAFFGMLLIVSGLVLLIACANVASLLLARSAARQQELSIRQAIGASRGRIVRQLLSESLLLAALGTLAGLALNFLVGRLLNGIRLPLPLPFQLHIEPDWRLLAYSTLLAFASALLCGLLPALRATRRVVNRGLKIEERQTGGRARLQRFLVTAQLAASVLLLTISFLFLKNLLLAANLSPGFDVHRTVWAYMRLAPEQHSRQEQIEAVVRMSLEKLRSLPGIDSAAALRNVPFNSNQHVMIDATVDHSQTRQIISYRNNAVGPDYFKTMGIPLLAGREFLPSDARNAPAVAVLNQTLARRLFGEKNAVGHTLHLHFLPPLTIVGVAQDSKYFTLGETNVSALYPCFFQSDNAILNLNFMVRSHLPPESVAREVNKALAAVDPTAALEVKPMQKSLALAMLPSQVGATLIGSMGTLALLLASVGLYGTMVYSVSRRLREFGLRMALGAGQSAVIRLVLRDSFWMFSSGLAMGLLLAFLATPALSGFLVVRVHDWTAFALTVASLAVVALLASLSPVLRAIRVDPAVSLRYE